MAFTTTGAVTKEQAVRHLAETTAMQEAALSELMTTEGQKMQMLISADDIQPQQLLRLNISYGLIVNAVIGWEVILQKKWDRILSLTSLREEAVLEDMIHSLVMHKMCLSQVLNAESGKLQIFLYRGQLTADRMPVLNNSIISLVETVSRLEVVLQSKLTALDGSLQESHGVGPQLPEGAFQR